MILSFEGGQLRLGNFFPYIGILGSYILIFYTNSQKYLGIVSCI